MAVNQMLRLNNMAKDLDVKSKQILDVLADAGYEKKTHSATLEPDEFTFIINRLSLENQMSGIDDYMNGKILLTPSINEEKEREAEKEAEKDSVIAKDAKKPIETPEVQEVKKPSAPKNQQNSKNVPAKDKMQRFQTPVRQKQDKEKDKKKSQNRPERPQNDFILSLIHI